MLNREYDRSLQEVMNRLGAELSNIVSSGGVLSGDMTPLVERTKEYMRASGMFSDLSPAQLDEGARFVVDDLFQLGPLEQLLADDDITEIMVNSPEQVLVERRGKICNSGVHFFDDAHVERIITQIASADNRRCDTTSPMCDCKLRRPGSSFDGSRVNAVWRPIAVDHPLLDIRKFRNDLLTPAALLQMGSMDDRCYEIIEALVLARMNVIISGGTGSGKTTLLNACSNFIPDDQRIITVEDTAELQLGKSHVLRLEARQANSEGVGAVTIRRLIQNTLRQRPDRIIVGECRGGEAFDMLQAMGTGHDGSLTTLHANDARRALSRLEMMIQMSEEGAGMPSAGIKQFITDAVDFIVQTSRFRDGSRRVTEIIEVVGMQGTVITTGQIIKFHELGMEGGRVVGEWIPGGDRFSATHRLRCENAGVSVSDSWFDDGRSW